MVTLLSKQTEQEKLSLKKEDQNNLCYIIWQDLKKGTSDHDENVSDVSFSNIFLFLIFQGRPSKIRGMLSNVTPLVNIK